MPEPTASRWALIRYRTNFIGYLLRWLCVALAATNTVLGTISLFMHHWSSAAIALTAAAFCVLIGVCNPFMLRIHRAAERHLALHRALSNLIVEKIDPQDGMAFVGLPGTPTWLVERSPNWATFAVLRRVEEQDARALADLTDGYTDQAVIAARSLALHNAMPLVSSVTGGKLLRRNIIGQIISDTPPSLTLWRSLVADFRATGHAAYYAEDYEITEALDALNHAVHTQPIPRPAKDPQ